MFRPGNQIAPAWAEQRIRNVIAEFDPFLAVDEATVGQVRKFIQTHPDDYKFDKDEDILAAVQKLGLSLKPEIEQARAEGWARSNYVRFQSGDDLVVNEVRTSGYADPSSANLYRDIINRLGKQHNWPPNVHFAAELAQAREESTRQRLINEATEGSDYYRVVEFGQVRAKPKTQLLGLNIEQLREVVALVEQRRMAENRSVEQQRIDLRVATNAARGYSVPRAGDRDSLAAESTASTSAHRGTLPSLSPEVENLFTDPATGEFYTSLGLKRLFTTQPRLVRTMMKTDLNFMNRLLQGEQIGD